MSEKRIVSIKSLEERADFFAGASLSAATRRAYQADWNAFQAFCTAHSLEALPASPETICLFLSDSADSGKAISTITRRCTSITALHEHFNYLSPIKDARVSRVLRGIKRTCGEPQRRSKAISWADLKKIVSQTDSSMLGVRDAALLSLGWASAMRRSEIVAMNLGDCSIEDSGMIVTIRRSKTDQEGHGYKIGIPRATVGEGLCPVRKVIDWVRRMTNDKPLPPGSPLFPNIGRVGKGKWWWQPYGRLADRMVSVIVKQYCNFAGLPHEQYSAHSLRRGLATEAAAAGVPERILSRHTRHQSLEVLRSYIEDGSIWTENPLSAIYSISSSHQNS